MKRIIKQNPEKNKKHNFYGHRRRAKERFLNSESTKGFLDYDIIELLLFYAIPRRDVKKIAKDLISKFHNIADLVYATKENIYSVEGANESVFLLFSVIKEIMARTMWTKVKGSHVLSSWSALMDYLKTTSGYKAVEEFRVLFLNKKNVLIADEIQTTGTIDQSSVYPREIIKRALIHESTAVILVHNHPSGDPNPSKGDIEITKKIIIACDSVNIKVHDHVIVSKDKFFSFKSNLLI